jgi:hypothetical protein
MAAAHLEVRQKDLTAARKILGMAIGERQRKSTEESETFVPSLFFSLLTFDPFLAC